MLAAQPKVRKRYSLNLDPAFPVATLALGGVERPQISPDGQTLYYVTDAEGAHRIMAWSMDLSEARPIRGSEGASRITVSPNGRALAFQASGVVWTLPVEGGEPVKQLDGYGSTPVVWLDDETIVATGDVEASPAP